MRQKLQWQRWCLSSVAFLVLILLSLSCRKIEYQTTERPAADKAARFFELPPTTGIAVQRVADELKRQNNLTGFINTIAEQQGYAIWNKSLVTIPKNQLRRNGLAKGDTASPAQDTLILIPLVLENTRYVNSFIAAKLSGQVWLKLYSGDKYDEVPFESAGGTDTVTAEKYALQIMLLDNLVFGRTAYRLTDDRLFSTHSPAANNTTDRLLEIHKNAQAGQASRMVTEIVSVCFSNYHCTLVPGYCTPHSCDMCWQCYDQTCVDFQVDTWYDDDWGGGGSTGGDNGSGGGGGGGNLTGPCNGNGNPMTGGRTTCGGGGGGGTGWVPVDYDDEQPQDPCTIAQNAAKKMDSLYAAVNSDSILATIPNLATQTYESGFPIIQKIRVTPYNTQDTMIVGYYTGGVHTGNDTGINYTVTLGIYEKQVAAVHTHPPKGYAAPSAKDVYILIENRMQNDYRYTGNFMAAANGSRYALTITDYAKAADFYNTMSQNLAGRDWNESSDIGKAFEKAQKFFEDKYEGNPDKINLAYEMTMAAVLKQYPIGITMNKKDSSGHFKPIIVKTVPDPKKPTKRVIYIQDCN